MTNQSVISRLSTKMIPLFAKRLFPSEWIEAGHDRDLLEAIAKKRRKLDGPRPDLVLQRSWNRATTDIAGFPLHLFTPKTGSTGRVLFYCHGGAFVVGPSSLEWLHAARFATAIGFDLALYEYPKVPEHDSTATRSATLTAYDTIADRYLSDHIAIAGLSAGGGLAVSTMLQLHLDGRDLPIAAALFSPWLDMGVTHPDAGLMADSDKVLPIDSLRHDGMLYAGPLLLRDPLVSPRFATTDAIAALPPTVVTAGEEEILLPEGQEFIDNLTAAGVDATIHLERYGQHAGIMSKSPEGSEVFEAAVKDMRRLVANA